MQPNRRCEQSQVTPESVLNAPTNEHFADLPTKCLKNLAVSYGEVKFDTLKTHFANNGIKAVFKERVYIVFMPNIHAYNIYTSLYVCVREITPLRNDLCHSLA
jgi:hypothetical protein